MPGPSNVPRRKSTDSSDDKKGGMKVGGLEKVYMNPMMGLPKTGSKQRCQRNNFNKAQVISQTFDRQQVLSPSLTSKLQRDQSNYQGRKVSNVVSPKEEYDQEANSMGGRKLGNIQIKQQRRPD